MKKINILLSSSIAVLLLSSCNPILDREIDHDGKAGVGKL